MSEDLEEGGTGNGKRKRGGATARAQADIVPEPRNTILFRFLVDCFEAGFPEKLTLHVVRGPGGRYLGPAVMEWPMKPQNKPPQEELVALANRILQVAQADCDGLDKANAYGVFAHDTLRSDRPYGRQTFKIFPSGTSAVVAEARGDLIYDDEDGGDYEGGGMPNSRLLMQLLVDERKNNRWMMEAMMNVFSGVNEQQTARIEQLEDREERRTSTEYTNFVKFRAATEEMLNQSEERKQRAEWQGMKNEMAREGISMFKNMILPAAAVYVSKGKVGIVEGLQNFMNSLDAKAEQAVFGTWEQGKQLTQGLLSTEQIEALVAIVEGRADPKTFPAIMATFTPEQFARAQQLVSSGVLKMTQVQGLIGMAKAMNEVNDREAKAAAEAAEKKE